RVLVACVDGRGDGFRHLLEHLEANAVLPLAFLQHVRSFGANGIRPSVDARLDLRLAFLPLVRQESVEIGFCGGDLLLSLYRDPLNLRSGLAAILALRCLRWLLPVRL